MIRGGFCRSGWITTQNVPTFSLVMINDIQVHLRPVLYGLIGFPLGHSFSKRYFTQKFRTEGIHNTFYELFPLEEIEQFPDLLEKNPGLKGVNVTIPYKKAVIPYLNELDETAAAIGAVNCISISPGNYLKGYNTDAIGFEQSLCRAGEGHWATRRTEAIILGDGGAANAVQYVLTKMKMNCVMVSRKVSPVPGAAVPVISWEDLRGHLMHLKSKKSGEPVLIINTTPLGMAPSVQDCPQLPFELLGPEHLVFDLIYNPEETLLLQRAEQQGCSTLNGLEMLYLQAEAAWAIWSANPS